MQREQWSWVRELSLNGECLSRNVGVELERTLDGAHGWLTRTQPYDLDTRRRKVVRVRPLASGERIELAGKLVHIEPGAPRPPVFSLAREWRRQPSRAKQLQVVVDFLEAWRYCPVASSPRSSLQCLEHAAGELLDALEQ